MKTENKEQKQKSNENDRPAVPMKLRENEAIVFCKETCSTNCTRETQKRDLLFRKTRYY